MTDETARFVETTCPRCGGPITVPYTAVPSAVHAVGERLYTLRLDLADAATHTCPRGTGLRRTA